MAENTQKDRPVPPSEREQKIIEFFAERWREWSTYVCPTDDADYGEGYDSAKHGCADTVDGFMEKTFGFEWTKAKVKVS